MTVEKKFGFVYFYLNITGYKSLKKKFQIEILEF